MPYWVNLQNAMLFAMACAGNLGFAALIGAVGFFIMLARQHGLGRSLQFGGSVIFVPLLMPAFACSLLITAFSITSGFVNESVTTSGEVVGLAEDNSSDGGITYSAIVEFQTPQGQTITFEDASKTCYPPCNEVGDVVPVRYRTRSPEDAIISGGVDIWVTAGIMGLLTAVFTILALVISVSSYRSGHWGRNAGELLDIVTNL